LSGHDASPALARQFAGYSVIGALNAGIHFMLVGLLVGVAGWSQVPANALAFAAANAFSFWANGRYTFGAGHGWRRYGRFAAVSLAGLALTLAISALGQARQWHFALTVLLLLVVLPLVSFTANRRWTWGREP
jgi:putative flippase GtrA